MMNRFGYSEEQPKFSALQDNENINRSMVRVRFPGQGMPLTYYNDRYDLQIGDCVYVDGKLSGRKGTVTEVNRNFKIRPSDFHKVICRVDPHVSGRFTLAGRHFLTADRNAIPIDKVLPWFCAPSTEDFVSGHDDSGFELEHLEDMDISAAIAERGEAYFANGNVIYLSLDRQNGQTIVRGSEVYEVNFTLDRGWIRGLTCTCPCAFNCKHEYAAMLQLSDTLEHINEQLPECTDYFASLDSTALLTHSRPGKGTLVLSDDEEADTIRF